MDTLDISHFEKCLRTLDQALTLYEATKVQAEPAEAGAAESDFSELYRSACVKEFELLVEVAGKLLKKRLRPYFASNLEADRLPYEDVFRRAAHHGLLALEVAERWLSYRDIRNQTAHDYGAGYADRAVAVMTTFAADAHAVRQALTD